LNFEADLYSLEPLNLFQTEYDRNNPPIRLSYHNRNHYNSVRDPKNPAFGVGLGIAGLKPGVRLLLALSVKMLTWNWL